MSSRPDVKSNGGMIEAMKNFYFAIVIAFVAGCLVTVTVVSGCSEAADRTLTIHQFQSTKTYPGQFRVDTSELPSNAIESRSDSGGPGHPLTRIKIKMDYEIEVVLRLAGKGKSNVVNGN